jgi:hypothetical protein
MRGGSQSWLIQCNDGKYYIVKMSGNPQGPNVLANELLGSLVVGATGLPVADSSLIYLSDAFIDANSGAWFETGSEKNRPDAGVHYGSKLIGELAGPNRSTDYISRSQVGKITNRASFLGMYIMDVWANHQDNRQAILLGNPVDRTQEAFFIDNGHMFGGPKGEFKDGFDAPCHLEVSVYSDLWVPEEVAGWISLFERTIPDALTQAISFIPRQWYNGDLEALKALLMRRLGDLPQLVDARGPNHFTHRKSHNDILRLPSTGIRVFGTSS